MAKNKPQPTAETIPFEVSLDQLKSIVAELENGNLPLSVSLEKYALGVKSLKDCYDALESAQKKIEMLVRLDEQGKLITVPFEADATYPTPTKQVVNTGYSESLKTVKPSKTQKIENKSIHDEVDEDDENDPNSLF